MVEKCYLHTITYYNNDFSYKIQVAGAIALCNTPFATYLAMALRDKLHKKLPRVTSALPPGAHFIQVVMMMSKSQNG